MKSPLEKFIALLRPMGFCVGYVWLGFFVVVGGVHEYGYLLNEFSPEFNSWCQLPPEKDPIRKELYGLFLIQFIMLILVFLRKNQFFAFFVPALLFVFAYAIYMLIIKDWLCL